MAAGLCTARLLSIDMLRRNSYSVISVTPEPPQLVLAPVQPNLFAWCECMPGAPGSGRSAYKQIYSAFWLLSLPWRQERMLQALDKHSVGMVGTDKMFGSLELVLAPFFTWEPHMKGPHCTRIALIPS